MKSVWTPLALDDLDAAIDWVSDYDLDAALRLNDKVEQLVSRLKQFPYSGRPGRVAGTREAILGNYILVYTVQPTQIEILRFIHGAMLYP